jgi:hypothetical protein
MLDIKLLTKRVEALISAGKFTIQLAVIIHTLDAES